MSAIAALALFGILAVGAPPTLHTEPQPAKSLDGYTISFDTTRSYATYRFEARSKVAFSAQMGVTGDGQWNIAAGKVTGRGTHSTWCHDGDSDCDPKERHDWSIRWTNVELAPSGLILLTDTEDNKRHVFVCDDKKRCSPGATGSPVVLVKLIPAAKKTTLIDVIFAAPPDPSAFEAVYVRGRPTKNLRKVSEVWFASEAGDEHASELASKLAPTLGEITPKAWTFGDTPYDVIVVIGDTVASK